VAVINETLARNFFGDSDPVGERLESRSLRGSDANASVAYQIIGVVNDVKNYEGPAQPVRPMAYVPYRFKGFVISVRTNAAARSSMNAIQQSIWSVDRDMTFYDFEPLEETFERLTYSAPRFGVMALAPLAITGLLLAISGIFSVMAYNVTRRTREMGVRMALGASGKAIAKTIVGGGLRLILAGTCVGLIASYWLTRLLAKQIWGVPPDDPWTFAAVIALIFSAGLAACVVPAWRATRIEPVTALRSE
jgi:putative ABC transport system permease protein